MATKSERIAVVGGGLVGSLEACYMAKRGYRVDLFESREDIREAEIVRGRSINMALSVRGRKALQEVGLEDEVISEGIPMYARMIHDLDGTCRPIPYGTEKTQYIMSIDRRRLNEILLTGAEKLRGVNIFFESKILKCDSETGTITLLREGNEEERQYDVIIGCDGAYSIVRRQMMRSTKMDYSQTYIPHGYKELIMPAKGYNDFSMPKNYLHIWARNTFMLIGLPNPDGSFTMTMFMPFDLFDSIKTENDLKNFFQEKFPDALELIGWKQLCTSYFNGPALPVISVKCTPHHSKNNKMILLGDAAHAIVPFYGQGMNCGFEDCTVLNSLLDKHKDNFELAFKEYSETRCKDTHAIADLSMSNYIEMRASVNSSLFLIRKHVDKVLYKLLKSYWMPLYSMVAFSRIPYHKCIEKRKKQDSIFRYGLLISLGAASFWVAKYGNVKENFDRLSDLCQTYMNEILQKF